MAISPKQLQAIKDIIALHHQAFVANYVSPAAVTQQVKDELRQKGLLSVQVSSIEDAYLYGLVLAQLNDPNTVGLTYPQFRRRVEAQPVPLTQPEVHAVAMANAKAAQYIVGLGNRVSARTGEVVIEADKALRAQMRGDIRDTVAEAVAERKTVKQIKSDLGHATQDWTRDLDRIAVTEQQFAMQEGFAQHVVKTRGDDAKVAKLSAKDCCPQCAALYLEDGGKPRIFTISDLEKNGTNVGRRQAEWRATIGPVHPNCSCQLVSVGPHLTFNDKNQLVVGKPAQVSPGDATVEEIGAQMEPKSVSARRAIDPVAGVPPLAALNKGVRLNLNGLMRKTARS